MNTATNVRLPARTRGITGLMRDPFGFCMTAAREGDGVVRIKAGPASAYLVSHPAYVRQVLVDNAANYNKGSMMDGIRVALGNGLFTADGEAWRRQRRLMQPAFRAAHVEQLGQVIENTVAAGTRRWDAAVLRGEPVDLLAETIRLNTDIILGAVLGVDVPEPTRGSLIPLIDAVFAGMSSRMWTFFLPAWLPTPGRRAYRRAISALDARIRAIIDTRLHDTHGQHNDLLDLLLQARDDQGMPLTPTGLRDEVFTLFLAGNESTATSLTWTCYLLSLHPASTARLRAELDESGVDTRPLALAGGRCSTYLQRVISEGFRLYPAFPMYFRTSIATDKLGPYEIPANANMIVSPYATHHDPRYWPSPDIFDPDRFAPDRFTGDARNAYYPFGIGQRRCIGETLSLAIAHTTVATLIERYDITPVHPHVKGRYAMTYQPSGGLPVHLHQRSTAGRPGATERA